MADPWRPSPPSEDDGMPAETIGHLADRIPRDGDWHEAYGVLWKRLPEEGLEDRG